MTDRYDYENEYQSQGAYISFSNIQAEDMFLFAVLLDPSKCKENKSVHRIFQQQYKMISLFSMEELYYSINQQISSNDISTNISITGDVMYQLAVVATWDAFTVDQQVGTGDEQNKTIKKFAYCTNLGASQIERSVIQLDNYALDQNNTDTIIILNNLLKGYDKRQYFNKLSGNVENLTNLSTSKPKFKTLTTLRMFFSDSPQKSFPHLRAGQPTVTLKTKFRSADQLICCTKNLKDFGWGTKIVPKRTGYISTEIFLNEHERMIHVNTDAHSLFEQNMIHTCPGTEQTFITNFLHPVKYLYWAAKKKKYSQGNSFLSFDSFVDHTKSRQDFLYDASIRFILKYALYLDKKTITGPQTVQAAQTDLLAAQSKVTFVTDKYDVIQSMFSDHPNWNTDLFGEQSQPNRLVNETLTSEFSVETIFKRLQAQPLQINGQQKFQKNNSLIFSSGELMTLEEVSIPVEQWEEKIKNTPVQFGTIQLPLNLATSQQQLTSYVVFSLFTKDTPAYSIYTYDGTNFSVAPQTAMLQQKLGTSYFSNVTRDSNFNYGLSDFDIVVYQWDNYGKNLDKSSDQISTTELKIGSAPRFKKSGFYTSMYHQYQFFPGFSADGIHVQSFCLEPQNIQCTGSLNFTKADAKMTIQLDKGNILDTTSKYEQHDFFVGAVVYNIIDYQSNTHQVLYATSMNI